MINKCQLSKQVVFFFQSSSIPINVIRKTPIVIFFSPIVIFSAADTCLSLYVYHLSPYSFKSIVHVNSYKDYYNGAFRLIIVNLPNAVIWSSESVCFHVFIWFSVNCVWWVLIGPEIRRGWSKLADGKQVPSRFSLPCLWQVSSLYGCWQNGRPSDWHAMTDHAHLINFVTVSLSQSVASPAVCYWPPMSTNEIIFFAISEII